jgi:integrase
MPLKLKKRGEIWHYTGTVAGRRLRGSTKTSQRAEAEKEANRVESLWLHRDRFGIADTLTFAQAAIEYRKEKGDKRFLVMVEDYWKDTPVKDITRGALRRAAITLLPKASGAHRNRAVIVPTLAVVNHSAKMDLCAPMKADRFKEALNRKEPVTIEWLAAFMAHASPHLGAWACFMFGTGARPSEAIAVHWRDVDLAAAKAKITMGKIGGETRVAHLPVPVVAALASLPGGREPDDQVFPYAARDSCTDPWDVAVRRAGIKRLTPHCCRHGFATTMLHAGYDPITVAKLGGWKDPSQLFKTYGHAMNDTTVTEALWGKPRAHGTAKDAQDTGIIEENGVTSIPR